MTSPDDDPARADCVEPQCSESLDLVRRAQRGEHGALNTLLERYYSRIHRIVRLRLGARLRRHLESGDILQETFVAAVHGFDRFEARNESSLLHWLSRIAENQIRAAHDYHTAKKRDSAHDISMQYAREALGSGDVCFEPCADQPQPLERLILDEDVMVVESCLDKLREDYRDVILMRDYMGGHWKDVAIWLHASGVNSVRMLHARAITELSRLVHRSSRG